MAKRLTDSDKWKKPFIRGLQASYKLLWLYILDDCDHAGIWQVDFEVARIRIGEQVDMDQAAKAFHEHITIIDKNKWFIHDFIDFQYGELSATNNTHKSVLKILDKYNLAPRQPLTSTQGYGEGLRQGYGEGKGLSGTRENFEMNLGLALDEITLESYSMQFKNLNMAEQVQIFRLLCDTDPQDYYTRDSSGLRKSFLNQIKNASMKATSTHKLSGQSKQKAFEL